MSLPWRLQPKGWRGILLVRKQATETEADQVDLFASYCLDSFVPKRHTSYSLLLDLFVVLKILGTIF